MAKIALFFMLDKPMLPENFGIKMSLPALVPFYESLSRDSSVTKLNYSDSTAYNFRFFRKPFQTDVLVVVKDVDYQASADIDEHFRRNARGILELAADKAFDDPAYTQRALWLPKGVTRQEFNTLARHFGTSAEIDPEHLIREDIPGGWMMLHPDGFILGSKSESDFLRVTAECALAMSYRRQARDGLQQLSIAAATAGSPLAKQCEELSRFHCQYGFQNPVDAAVSSDNEYGLMANHLAVPSLLRELQNKVGQALNTLQARTLGSQSEEGRNRQTPPPSSHNGKNTGEIHDRGQPNPVLRTLFALVILAVAGSVAYLVGTDAGQLQWHTWTRQSP